MTAYNNKKEMKKSSYKDLAFIFSSTYRRKALELLKDKPKTPTMICKINNWVLSSTSRTLIDLVNRGFLEVLNSEDKHNRFYSITNRGIKALKFIEEGGYEK